MKKSYLILEDGTVFQGYGFGASGGAIGELVFTTGVCGYLETLTDPAFYGQIVLQTFPLIGNYGVIEEDLQGECYAKGYVVREWCDTPSNFRCQYDIDTLLKNKGIPGIYGVDTRQIARLLRDKGVMNAIITDTVPQDLTEVKNYTIQNAVEAVTCKEITNHPVDNQKYSVVLMDLGISSYIFDELHKRGCGVTCVPASTTADQILAMNPNGVIVMGGPGDPAQNTGIMEQVGNLMGKVPMLGINLGHQIMALADGATTEKMKYGHRGGNQPASEIGSDRTFITSQNHGYTVISQTLKHGNPAFYNANDKTCEGIDYKELNALSVQFHPQSHPGHRDPSFVIDRFVDMMGGK